MKTLINKLFTRSLILLLIGGLFGSCSDLLDADNPNNLLEEDLSDPRSATPMVNGSQATTTRALANMLSPYSTASDELTWVGSRDAWRELQFGEISSTTNEFTDGAFFFVGEARWWGDEVIERVEGFNKDGRLSSPDLLGRAYLYGAINYIFIADMFDDFVIGSDKLEPAPPVGDANMSSLYDQAITYINNGLSSGPSDATTTALTGLLARAHYSKALWSKLNPVNTADPLISDASATAAARDALALMGPDYKFLLDSDSSTPDVVGGLDIGQQVNERLEMRISDDYIIADAATGKQPANLSDGDPSTTISLMDPIDNIPDPVVYDIVVDFTNQGQFSDFTIVSAREMYLILAEAALADGDMDEFTTQINNLRALDSELTPYSGQIDARELLEHSRRVNLFLQGRRLADHYRFNTPATDWLSTSAAVTSPGTFFPITISEIRANPLIQ